jgi:hypothetical protein
LLHEVALVDEVAESVTLLDVSESCTWSSKSKSCTCRLDLSDNHLEGATFPWHLHTLHDFLSLGVGELSVDGRHVVKEFSDSTVAAEEFFGCCRGFLLGEAATLQ